MMSHTVPTVRALLCRVLLLRLLLSPTSARR